jgi:hypothetical protein
MKKHSIGPLVLASVLALGLLHGCANDPQNLTPASQNNAPTYGSPKAENFPAGSRDWWEAMVREGRAGSSRD